MSDSYVSSIDLLDRITTFISDLASMGVTLKAVCFYESTAANVAQQAEYQGQHFCEKPQSRVEHVVSHGTINGVEITSPGGEK